MSCCNHCAACSGGTEAKGSQEAVGSVISKAVPEIVMLLVFLFLLSSRKHV